MGRYYTEGGNIDRPDERPMEVICVRLGTLPPWNAPGRDYRSLVRLVQPPATQSASSAPASNAPNISYEIIYGASNNKWKIYDTPYAWELLDFMPVDSAEDHWRKE